MVLYLCIYIYAFSKNVFLSKEVQKAILMTAVHATERTDESLFQIRRTLRTHNSLLLLNLILISQEKTGQEVSYFTAVSSATSMEMVIIPADSPPAVLTHSASSVIYNTTHIHTDKLPTGIILPSRPDPTVITLHAYTNAHTLP